MKVRPAVAELQQHHQFYSWSLCLTAARLLEMENHLHIPVHDALPEVVQFVSPPLMLEFYQLLKLRFRPDLMRVCAVGLNITVRAPFAIWCACIVTKGLIAKADGNDSTNQVAVGTSIVFGIGPIILCCIDVVWTRAMVRTLMRRRQSSQQVAVETPTAAEDDTLTCDRAAASGSLLQLDIETPVQPVVPTTTAEP